MSLLTIDEAAKLLDTNRETIDEWIKDGMLPVHTKMEVSAPLVDQEELEDLAESVGWSMLSQEGWDGPEEE